MGNDASMTDPGEHQEPPRRELPRILWLLLALAIALAIWAGLFFLIGAIG